MNDYVRLVTMNHTFNKYIMIQLTEQLLFASRIKAIALRQKQLLLTLSPQRLFPPRNTMDGEPASKQ